MIVVLGMHRTGTSMVSRLLQLMGVYMGSTDGHYEDWDFVKLNIAVIAAAGGDTFRPGPQEAIDRVVGYEKYMQELVAERNAQHELWGFKDPRTLLVLAHWKKYLHNPVYILTARTQEAIL